MRTAPTQRARSLQGLDQSAVATKRGKRRKRRKVGRGAGAGAEASLTHWRPSGEGGGGEWLDGAERLCDPSGRTAGLRAFDEAAARLAGLAGQWDAGGNCGRLAHGEEAEDMYLGF